MLRGLGAVIFSIGLMMAESENLLIPIVVTLTGALILLITCNGEEAEDE